MKLSSKIVNNMPLDQLWTDDKILDVKRDRKLNTADIQELLKQNPVEFVIASPGSKLKYIPIEQCYDKWKNEIKNWIVDEDEFGIDDYKEGFAYVATEWKGNSNSKIILLEMHH